MKNFFRVINTLLFAAALLAGIFCAYFAAALKTFPAESFNTQISELSQQTQKLGAAAIEAEEESERRIELLRADLRNNGEEGAALADSLEQLNATLAEKRTTLAEAQAEAELLEDLPGAVVEARALYGQAIRTLEDKILAGESELRICYWTLDDGPSYITDQFLDALDEMDHVHVTFFTANEANDAPNEEELLRREMKSGHSVQNHSFSHAYWAGGSVYISAESFEEQIRKQDEWIYETTGFHTGVFRFPGGAAWGRDLLPESVGILEELGYPWIDWNCNLYDAGAADKLPSAALETSRAVNQSSEEKIAIILSHDWNRNTLIALKEAVPQLQEKGYVFLPLFQESAMMGLAATR